VVATKDDVDVKIIQLIPVIKTECNSPENYDQSLVISDRQQKYNYCFENPIIFDVLKIVFSKNNFRFLNQLSN
jgi:hypothetical protein